jgi:hypothetical protein
VAAQQRLAVGRRLVADPLHGRSQLPGEVAADRRLQLRPAVVAELHREAHHRGRPGACRLGQLGNGAERDDLRSGEHDGGDPPLGRGQPIGPFPKPLLHLHEPATVAGTRRLAVASGRAALIAAVPHPRYDEIFLSFSHSRRRR